MLCEDTSLALAIVAENSFWLSNLKFPYNVQQAAKHYTTSSVATNVSTQLQVSFGNKTLTISYIMGPVVASQYDIEIATPLTDLVLNNLLCMLTFAF